MEQVSSIGIDRLAKHFGPVLNPAGNFVVERGFEFDGKGIFFQFCEKFLAGVGFVCCEDQHGGLGGRLDEGDQVACGSIGEVLHPF